MPYISPTEYSNSLHEIESLTAENKKLDVTLRDVLIREASTRAENKSLRETQEELINRLEESNALFVVISGTHQGARSGRVEINLRAIAKARGTKKEKDL